MQPRFEKRVGSAPFGLVEQARFRAAFDFMRLRAENGELDMVLSDWWEAFSLASDDLRNDMVDEVKLEQQRARTTRPPRTPRVHQLPARSAPDAAAKSAADNAGASQDGVQTDVVLGDGTEAPKKRRRRRRPSGRGAGDAPAQDPQE
jgi:poly(A) polymerase